jgi:hypothetical protein
MKAGQSNTTDRADGDRKSAVPAAHRQQRYAAWMDDVKATPWHTLILE